MENQIFIHKVSKKKYIYKEDSPYADIYICLDDNLEIITYQNRKNETMPKIEVVNEKFLEIYNKEIFHQLLLF